MAAGEQTSDREFYGPVLAYDNFANLLRESVNVIGHSEIICGNDAIRKQDMRRCYRAIVFLDRRLTPSTESDGDWHHETHKQPGRLAKR